MQPQEIVDFGMFLSEWSKCLTAKHQRDSLYRLGQFDDCTNQWNDIKIACQAKVFTPNTADAIQLIQNTYHYKRTTISPTAGVIWTIKDKPGWT